MNGTVLGFFAGAALGGGAVYLWLGGANGGLSEAAPVEQPDPARSSVTLRGGGSGHRGGPVGGGAPGEGRTGTERGDATRSSGVAEVLKGALKIDGNEFDLQEMIQKSQREQLKAASDAKVLALRSALDLSDEQAAEIEEFLGKQAEVKLERLGSMMAVGGPSGDGVTQELDGPEESRPSAEDFQREFDDFLDTLLDAEQGEAYLAFKEEDLRNRLEGHATSEVAHLQSLVPLSGTQKEDAFEVFAGLAAERFASPDQAGGRHAAFGDPEAKLDALATVLSPEQLAIYKARNGQFFVPPAAFGGDVLGISGTVSGAATAISISVDSANFQAGDQIERIEVDAPGPAVPVGGIVGDGATDGGN